MKVFTRTHKKGDRGMRRVVAALEAHAPKTIEIVGNMDDAELVILHVIGRCNRMTELSDRLRRLGKKYAVIQYAIRSTKTPHTSEWLPLWKHAALVWSYYNLRALCQEDGTQADFTFHHAPLGTDFYHGHERKKYMIATSGLSYLTESVRECVIAAGRSGKKVFHVGPAIGHHIECSNGMSDEDLMKKYAQCEYVSGLRRIEGFEFPVIEGLMCGAKPIVFDKPHYRHWFHDLAIFIPEGPREQVIESLRTLFRAGAYPPVMEKDKDVVRERFDWGKIIHGFYSSL